MMKKAAAVILACFALSSCGNYVVEGVVVETGMEPAHTETSTSCNGDPVLLICTDNEVEVEDRFFAVVKFTTKEGKQDACRVFISKEAYTKTAEGLEVSISTGCSYTEWPV